MIEQKHALNPIGDIYFLEEYIYIYENSHQVGDQEWELIYYVLEEDFFDLIPYLFKGLRVYIL